jgi:hypothetical protein
LKKTVLLFALLFCLLAASCANGHVPAVTLPPDPEAYSSTINLEVLSDEPGTLEGGVYSDAYLTFRVPSGYFLERVENVDVLSPRELSGDSITVSVGNKVDLSLLTVEKLTSDFDAFYPGASVSGFQTGTNGNAGICSYSVTLPAEGRTLYLRQVLLNAEKCVTLTFTDATGTAGDAFAEAIGTIAAK